MRALESSRTEAVPACFKRLFERHGLPGAIRSDNGSPVARVRAVLGLSRLSAWWLVCGAKSAAERVGGSVVQQAAAGSY